MRRHGTVADEYFSLDAQLSSIKGVIDGVIREELEDRLVYFEVRDRRVSVWMRCGTDGQTRLRERLAGLGFHDVVFK